VVEDSKVMVVSEEEDSKEEEGSREEVYLVSDFVEEDSLDKCEDNHRCSQLVDVAFEVGSLELDMEGQLLQVFRVCQCKGVFNLE